MARKRETKSGIIYILIFVVIAAAAAALAFQSSQLKACTQEAKVCPDGSAVGRAGPNCEFAPCLSSCKCPEGFIPSQSGEYCIVKCAPNEACPAIATSCENATVTNKTTGELCKESGGTIKTQLCCGSVSDFPNTCLIGACGCSSSNSKEVKVCDCGEGKCFDGKTCVSTVDVTKSCESDSDCVGATCCHPTSCINKAYRGVCNELCTQVCQGPLDCGAGSCGCVNNVCTIIPK